MTEFAPPSSAILPQEGERHALLEHAEAMRNREATIGAMEALAVKTVAPDGTNEVYYEAADPGYKSSFTRDSLIAMTLRGDPEALRSQVDYSARRLATLHDSRTGAEPGKAHHELPDYVENGLSTAYNGCDTTAELLNSCAALAENGQAEVLETHAHVIKRSIAYIKTHVNQAGLFEEDPSYAGATEPDGRQRRFALKVTYWKDSELNRLGRREPHYPIVYSLVHFQNANALQRIGQVLHDERLIRYGRYMTEAGLQYLWRNDHFVTAIDGDGEVDAPSSDSLQALLYIAPEHLPSGHAAKIEEYSRTLETSAGYRAGIPVSDEVDPYHMMIWTHWQALGNAAARRHELYKAEEVTRAIVPFIVPQNDFFPETLDPVNFDLRGNPKQLWAMGAYLYFQNPGQALL